LAQSPNIYLSLLLKSSSKEKPFLTLRLVRTLLRVDQFRRPLAATLFRSIHLGFLGAAVAGCRGPGIQPAREFPPNKTKENQRIPRKNAWISLDFFGRFGAFQWVTSEKNKIFARSHNSRLRLCAHWPQTLSRSRSFSPCFGLAATLRGAAFFRRPKTR
jgi:hypothetical protein